MSRRPRCDVVLRRFMRGESPEDIAKPCLRRRQRHPGWPVRDVEDALRRAMNRKPKRRTK